MRLDRVLVSIENRGVDELVLFCSLKLHAVFNTKLLLHAIEIGVQNYFLQASDHVIEVVVILVAATVGNGELLVTIITFEKKRVTT